LLARVRAYALYIDPLLGRAAALRGKIKMEAREIRVPPFFTGPPWARAT
jgi:hypothetical protein